MKKIEAIIKPAALPAVVTALTRAELGEVTVSEVQGSGRHPGWNQVYRGAVYTIDSVGKFRIEVVVPDERIDEVVSLLCRVARTRGISNGKVFVSSLRDVVPVRAGSR